jgi:FkbM family methyltransferase
MRRVARNGVHWVVNDNEGAFWDRVERGEWEPATFAVLSRLLDREHSYVDVGSWIGPTVLYGAQLARHCYALEPDPVAFAQLRENVALNDVEVRSRITLSEHCLASACGPVVLGNKTSAAGGDSMSSLLFADDAVAWEVLGVTLERLMEDFGIEDCSLVKMDIEGGEFELLPAMAGTLARCAPTVHLSLHPAFLVDPAPQVLALAEVLALYRHVYTPGFEEVGPGAVLDPDTFGSCYELVLTNLDCAAPGS